MKQQMYLIREYNLIGTKLYTYKAIPAEQAPEYKNHRFYKISENPKGQNESEKFLPYTATVTEDLPGGVKWKPKVYTGCKLLTETHGGYLQFYHEETNQVLRIAINSHYYQPTK